MIMIISFIVNHFLFLFLSKKAACEAAQIVDKRLKCLFFTFQRDGKHLKSRKDAYRSGANCTFVSTGTLD
ncbi:hypothetical protein ABE58_07330 [Bacillus safensis]|nr:hypothetical protein [Bacillus safensis]